MTGRDCYVLAIYNIDMFGKKRVMHTRRSTSYLWSNIWKKKKVLEMDCCKCTGELFQVNGTMNVSKYQDILTENLVASARRLRLGHKQIVRPDNDFKNTSNPQQIKHQWPSQSLDLNQKTQRIPMIKFCMEKCSKFFQMGSLTFSQLIGKDNVCHLCQGCMHKVFNQGWK